MLVLEIKIFGRVQGVGFRFFCLNLAKKLQIKGFVKNEFDGSVYLEINKTDKINFFIENLKKNSPGFIDKININEIEKNINLENFIIKY